VSMPGSSRQVFAALALAGAGLVSSVAVHAGPEVTIYLTLPLSGESNAHLFGAHVFGLRLDRSAAPPGVRIINPDSPLNRRPLVDLQMGANSALRLDLDRRLTWDIDHQELRQSSRPAAFSLRLPMHNALPEAVSPVHQGVVSKPGDASGTNTLLAAALANPLQNGNGKALMKSLPVEP
jgi:hypothetical protein